MAHSKVFKVQDDGSPWPLLFPRPGYPPEVVNDVLHARALADALGIHPNTISRWRRKGMPHETWRNLVLANLPEVLAWSGYGP